MSLSENYIIGISGGSGAGKSRFLDKIRDRFTGKEISCLSQDNYYKPRKTQPVDEDGYINFDLPEAINLKKFQADLDSLKSGKSIELAEYAFNTTTKRKIRIDPTPVILVEGIFVFYFTGISKMIDLKLYIETGSDLMLKRRLLRDQQDRGYEKKEIIHRFEKHVVPAHEKYVFPFRKSADLIIPNNDGFDTAYEVVASFIKERIK